MTQQCLSQDRIHQELFGAGEGGFPGWPSGKESACQCRRQGFNPWVGKISYRRAWQPTPVFLPGEFIRQRSLVGYSPWGRKELDTTEIDDYNLVLFIPLIYGSAFQTSVDFTVT